MIKRLIPLIFALIIGFAVGVTVGNPNNWKPKNSSTTNDNQSPKVSIKETDSVSDAANNKAMQNLLQPLMDNIYNGLQKEDYSLYGKDFLPETKDEANFKAIMAQGKTTFGKMDKPVFLGSYQQNGNVLSLWKSSTAKEGMDALYTMTVMKINDDWKVVSFSIQ